VIFWDDGFEKNAYVVSNNNARTRFRFVGDAKITSDWSAGYLLEIGARYANSGNRNQTTPGGGSNSNSIDIRHSAWWIDNKNLGRLWVGKTTSATDGITEINLANLNTVGSGDAWIGGFFLRNANGSLSAAKWNNVTPSFAGAWNIDGDRNTVVKYVTPTFAGFTLGASWGEDDYWDIALRYSGEHSGFKLAFATAYSESTDASIGGGVTGATNDNQYFQVGGMIKHLASGLWIHGTYGKNFIDDVPNHAGQPDITGWYLKAGWTSKFHSLGNTHFYGEYGRNEDAFVVGAAGQLDATDAGTQVVGSTADRFGVGVVQEIDAAAMSLWAKWRHHELDGVLANGAAFDADDVDMFLAGAVIFY